MRSIIFLVALLMALVAVSNARPLMFFADQTDTLLGINKSWAGLAFAWTNIKKGQTPYRVRIFGATHIGEEKTGAWINFQNGTIIEHLALPTNTSNQYYLGDLRLNASVWDLFTSEQVYVTVASKSHTNGSVSGYFRCRPYQGVSVLDGSQVVSGTPASSSLIGLGWASIDVADIFSLPEDIVAQAAAISASTTFSGRVIHDNNTATSITLHGPADATSTAGVLATATLYGSDDDGVWSGHSVNEDFFSITSYEAYFQVSGSAGDLRGQIYPLLTPTRRNIPFDSETVNGNTVIPSGGWRTLRYANQEGSERNPNSYINLVSTSSGSNFTYLGLFYFNSGVNKAQFELARALTIEVNAKIVGSASWLFEVFDSTSGEYIPLGTLTTADTWTAVQIQHWSFDVPFYADVRGQVAMRVSVNSATSSSLQLDLFGIRTWSPDTRTNAFWKLYTLSFNNLPGEFSNGTTINV